MSAAQEVLSHVRISEVYTALTGIKPRRSAGDRWRGLATWRGGEGFNVSMDDRRGVWHDFVAADRGGMLDLVQRIRGGSRADALRWLADFAGVAVDQRTANRAERRVFAVRRQTANTAAEDIESWRDALIPELNARKIAAVYARDDQALRLAASLCNLLENGSADDIARAFIRHRVSSQADAAHLIRVGKQQTQEAHQITAEVVLLLALAEGTRNGA